MDLSREHEELLKKALERYNRRLPNDPELQRSLPSRDALDRLSRECKSSIACVELACRLYAGRSCFGERDFEVKDGAVQHLPRFRTLTYAALWARVQAFASGLHHGGLAAPGDRVAISGFASVDWMVASLAGLYLAVVTVPLQTNMAPVDLEQILGEAAPRVVVCSREQLPAIAATLPRCASIRSLVVMDLVEQDRAQAEALAARAAALREQHGDRVTVITMAEVERVGGARGVVPYVVPSEGRAGESDPLMTILYTSGSTGTPKGAMFPERIVHALWREPLSERVPFIAHIGVNYMPLNHAAGWFEATRSMVHGGVTHFVLASDMSTLFEDIRLARPTRLMFVPRVSAMIHQHYQAELVRRTAGVSSLPDKTRIEGEIMEEMRRSFLGDRLVIATRGTAPTAPDIVAFLERCFEIPVFDGYGSTEAGMISFEGRIARAEVVAYKLVDVPELGYRTTDEPYPRGELCVKTRRHVPGYYKNPAATEELFDDEGYLQTGDIVELRPGDEIVWLDRKKNILKLAQGEFVSTSRLEGLYAARSPFIHQIYVHGSSLRAYLLAVVVPDPRAVAAHLGAAPDEATLRKLLRGELDRIAREEGLQGWEAPREILIETSPFSQENGLLTSSNKPSRPKLRERYGARLEQIYADIERTQLEKLQALEGEGGEASVAEQVALAVEVTLGLRAVDLDQSFLRLGGDSLAAVRLTSILADRVGADVPVGLVLDPTSSVRTLLAYVESSLEGARAVSFEQVHGAGATVVRAADLRLDKLLASGDLDAAARAAAIAPAPRVTFLTGANGFLGRFLLLELLAAAPPGGKVVCVVRASSDAEALARLDAVYASDPALRLRFRGLAGGGRLEALAGDLMKPRFGLTDAAYDRLGDEVDGLLHNGALVNHAFSYRDLFEPNVLGTAEIIRLALRRRLKPIGYVSTVGVAGGLDRPDPVREDEGGRSLWRERPIDHGYAVGYATSKWAGEVLLEELAERFGVPVAVFRCSMIMPHRGYVGQVNSGDFLTRLLVGVVDTGVAPRSFYADAAGAHHFDGLPVDFVARSIASISGDHRGGYATYHVTNPHWDDGVSLDTMIAWIRSAGYAVKQIDDHARWLDAFRTRLEALSPAARQRSPLPILQQWAQPMRREMRFDTARIEQRLREIASRAGATAFVGIPRLTEAYLHKYLRDMVAAGLIEEPGRRFEVVA